MNGIKTLEAKARAKDEANWQRLEAEVERRRQQEQDRSRGEPVWFSRRIHDGHLHHWALFAHGKKYELRLPSRDKYKDMLPHGRLVGSVVPSARYEARVSPWTLRDEMLRQRDENLARDGRPHALDYYLCQIGWTRLTEAQVDAACEATAASFGVYVLGFNDCQSFLRALAGRIIDVPADCALDWPWFTQNVETEYHELQLLAPDENIRAFQMYLHAAVLGAAGAAAGAVHEAVDAYQKEAPMTADESGGGGGGNNTDGGQGGGGTTDDDCSCDCSC